MDIKKLIQANLHLARLDLEEGDYKSGWVAGLEDLLSDIESVEEEDAEDMELEIKLQRYVAGCATGDCQD